MLEILKKDLKLIFNIKKQMFVAFVFLFIFFLFSTIFSGFMKEQRLIDVVQVGIIDQEDSRLSKMLVGHFKNNDKFTTLFKVTVDDQKTIEALYDDDEFSAIIYIPDGFTDSLLRFKNTPLKITLNANYPLQNTVLENIMTSYSTYIKAVDVGIYSLHEVLEGQGLEKDDLNSINDVFSANMVLTALGRNELFEDEVIETFPSASSNAYFIYAIILLMIIFIATSGASLVSDELKSMCLHRYKSTASSYLKFSLSKITVMYLNLVMVMLPMIFAIKYFQPHLSMKYTFFIFLFLSLVTLFFITFSITIGLLFFKNEMSLLISTMTTLMLGILGGHFIPIQIMPKFVQDLSSFTPNYWMLRACLYLNNQRVTQELLLTSMWILIATCFMIVFQHFLYKRGALWEK